MKKLCFISLALVFLLIAPSCSEPAAPSDESTIWENSSTDGQVYYAGNRVGFQENDSHPTYVKRHWSDPDGWGDQYRMRRSTESIPFRGDFDAPEKDGIFGARIHHHCFSKIGNRVVEQLQIPNLRIYMDTLHAYDDGKGLATVEFDRGGLVPHQRTMPFIVVFSPTECEIIAIIAANLAHGLDVHPHGMMFVDGRDRMVQFPSYARYYTRVSAHYGISNSDEPFLWVAKRARDQSFRYFSRSQRDADGAAYRIWPSKSETDLEPNTDIVSSAFSELFENRYRALIDSTCMPPDADPSTHYYSEVDLSEQDFEKVVFLEFNFARFKYPGSELPCDYPSE